MVVIGFADVHGSMRAVEQATEAAADADVVLLLGDVTHFGGEKEARRIVDAVRPHCARVFAVPGNCDRPDAGDYLEREGLGLHGRSVLLDGVAFVGVGKSLPCPGRMPNETTEDGLRAALDQAASQIPDGTSMILVAHQPPYGTLNDVVHSGAHVGSHAIRSFIELQQPLVCFTGHIHEGAGIDSIGETKVINPGPLDLGRYAYAEVRGSKLEALEVRTVG